AATRLSCCCHDGVLLVARDQTLFEERLGDMRHGRHILAVIPPGNTWARSIARSELIDAAAVCIDHGPLRGVRTLVGSVSNSIAVRVEFASQRKHGIKWSLVGDVGPDARPVRRQSIGANP